jgi:hypothetical protein
MAIVKELDTPTSALNCGGSVVYLINFLVRGNHDTKDTSTIVDALWQSYFYAINSPTSWYRNT